MDKQTLIREVAQSARATQTDTEAIIDAMVNVIRKSLKNGEHVQIKGLGKFEVATRAARQGHNPQTKEKIQISAHNYPKFTPGKWLRDAVDNDDKAPKRRYP